MIPRRILVVDDDPIARRLLSHILRRDGFEVVTAGDGIEALAVIARDRPEAVVTDRMMPGMDGVELLRAIRAGVKTAWLPVVIVTSSNDDRDRPEAESAGATAFLTKPVGSLELTATVQRALLFAPAKKG